MTKYFTMMAVRVACFVLMVVITPYGWYTWVLGIGAIFLPYFAVVIANVASGPADRAIAPERAIGAPTPPPSSTNTTAASAPATVIRISEASTRPPTPPDAS